MSKHRVWLNPVNSYHTGWLKYGLSMDLDDGTYDAEFRLADCARSVNLSIDVYSRKARVASVKKLRLIAKAAEQTALEIWEIDNG